MTGPTTASAASRSVPYVCAAIIAGGFAAIALSWRGAAALLAIPLQLPYAVSGGAGGLALIVFGVGVGYVHVLRVAAATEEDAIGEIERTLARAGVAIVVSRTPPHRHAARRARRAARRMYRSGEPT